MRTQVQGKVRQISKKVLRRDVAQHFLVYYDGGIESVVALRQACETAPRTTRVVAVYVDVVPYTQALDAPESVQTMQATAILAGALANARMWGVLIDTLSTKCHFKGPALVRLANEYAHAALFIGVDQNDLGRHSNPFVDYVLVRAPGKVVLVET